MRNCANAAEGAARPVNSGCAARDRDGIWRAGGRADGGLLLQRLDFTGVCCRCWCLLELRRSCRCRRSPRWGGSWPIPSPRPAGCTWCTPSRSGDPDGPLEPAAALAPEGGVGAAIRIAHVDFTYPAAAPGAVAVSIRHSLPGATVALVGPSGAGKTTIANLLLRFWDPTQGAIRLDGVDLRELTLDGLRGRVALVAQDTYLFNDTLGANVRAGPPGRDGGASRAGARARGVARVRRRPAGGAGHPGRRARRAAVRRPAPARGDRPRVPEGRAAAGAGRGDVASRHHQRGAGASGAGRR